MLTEYSVPNDLGFEFFLSNRVRIAQDGDTAKKEDQPLRITRAIFHWRLDKFHQFQRYHDPLKWNMAIYLALLVDDKAERDPNNLNYDNSRTRIRLNDTNKRYMIDFLRCFLEHHNTPAQFGIRESFITNWKDTKLDIFIVRGKLRGRVKDAYKRLTGDWETLLENRRSMVAPAAFEARFGKFVGVLIPGDQAYKTQRNHSNMEFQAVTTLSENTRAPRQEKWTTLLAAMETPFDTNMIADVEPQEGPRHVCQLEAAAKALESVQVQEILELLDADFA